MFQRQKETRTSKVFKYRYKFYIVYLFTPFFRVQMEKLLCKMGKLSCKNIHSAKCISSLCLPAFYCFEMTIQIWIILVQKITKSKLAFITLVAKFKSARIKELLQTDWIVHIKFSILPTIDRETKVAEFVTKLTFSNLEVLRSENFPDSQLNSPPTPGIIHYI